MRNPREPYDIHPADRPDRPRLDPIHSRLPVPAPRLVPREERKRPTKLADHQRLIASESTRPACRQTQIARRLTCTQMGARDDNRVAQEKGWPGGQRGHILTVPPRTTPLPLQQLC